MRITKRRTAKPRTTPVKHGEEIHGKRKLVRAVMQRGFSQRTSAKAVDTVVSAWKRAILAKDQHIQMPLGFLKVKRTPQHLHKKRIVTRTSFGSDLKFLKTWTIYNDLYRIIWRLPVPEWEKLLAERNPPTLMQAISMPPSSPRAEASSFADPDREIAFLARSVFSPISVKERKSLEKSAGGKTALLECLRRFRAVNKRFSPQALSLFETAIYYDCMKQQRSP